MPRSLLFVQPPRWFGIGHHPGRRIPPRVSDWLLEPGSLTRRLRGLCRGEFRVRLLRQDWDKPYADESLALGLSEGRRAVVREVALQWGDRPLVVARSVIPAKTLHGIDRRLAHLGTRPLGEILFADPRLRRTHRELATLDVGFWRPEWQAAAHTGIYGRRSRFTLGHGHTLLVAEFFLPDLFAPERD